MAQEFTPSAQPRPGGVGTAVLLVLLATLTLLFVYLVSFIHHDLSGSRECEGYRLCTARLHTGVAVLEVVAVVNVVAFIGVVVLVVSQPRRSFRIALALFVGEIVTVLPFLVMHVYRIPRGWG